MLLSPVRSPECNLTLSDLTQSLHSRFCFVLQPGYGPTITNSVLSNMGDDGLAAHGVYEMVARITSRTRTVTVAYWSCSDVSCLPINVGDTLLMYAPDQRNLGTSVVRTIVPANDPNTINGNSPNSAAVSTPSSCFTLVDVECFQSKSLL